MSTNYDMNDDPLWREHAARPEQVLCTKFMSGENYIVRFYLNNYYDRYGYTRWQTPDAINYPRNYRALFYSNSHYFLCEGRLEMPEGYEDERTALESKDDLQKTVTFTFRPIAHSASSHNVSNTATAPGSTTYLGYGMYWPYVSTGNTPASSSLSDSSTQISVDWSSSSGGSGSRGGQTPTQHSYQTGQAGATAYGATYSTPSDASTQISVDWSTSSYSGGSAGATPTQYNYQTTSPYPSSTHPQTTTQTPASYQYPPGSYPPGSDQNQSTSGGNSTSNPQYPYSYYPPPNS